MRNIRWHGAALWLALLGGGFTMQGNDSVAQINAATEQGVVGHWPLDEGTGATVRDVSPTKTNGEIVAAEWATGNDKDHNALEFVGPKSFVRAPHHEALNVKSTFTLAAWVRPESLSGTRVIMSKGREYWSSGYTFFLKGQQLGLTMNTEKNERFVPTAPCPQLKPQTWAHVAVTYDSPNNRLIFFCNGAPIHEIAASGDVRYLPPDPGFPYDKMPLHIGCLAAYHNWQFEGLMRDVKIYNRALAPDEIAALYKSTFAIAQLDPETREKRRARYLTATVTGRIVDENGAPADARLFVKGADSQFYGPRKLHYASGAMYAVDGQFSVKVPPGAVEITALRGFEYFPIERKIEIKSGATQRLDLKFERFITPASQKWFGGEHHIHYRTHGQILEDWTPTFAEACAVARAEGLNFASFKETIQNAPQLRPDFIGREDAFEGRSHQNVGGHFCWVNVDEQPNGDTFAFLEMQRLNTAGKNVIGTYTHPAGTGGKGLVDDLNEVQMARDMAIGVPLVEIPIWDILWGGDIKVWAPATWYRFLNLGFKLAASGYSDTDLNTAYAHPPGHSRVYARLDNLDWNSVVNAYRAGRTVVTNGPLLWLRADGQEIGSVLKRDGKSTLSLEIEAHAQSGIERVEIIVNGAVVQTLGGDGPHFKQTTTIPVDDTCWIAARCVARPHKYFGRYAHTSPFYVQVGDRPMKPRAEDVDFFLKWLADYRKVLPELAKIPRMKTNFAEIEEYIGKAEAAYRALPAQPRRWTTH